MFYDMDEMIAEQKKLLQQRAIIDERLSIIEGLIALKRRLDNTPPVYIDENTLKFFGAQKTQKRPRNILPPSTIVANVRELLIEIGRPMTRRELLKELEKRSVPIIGKDRAKVVGTMIWRAKEPDGTPSFINTEQGYWPSDIPLP